MHCRYACYLCMHPCLCTICVVYVCVWECVCAFCIACGSFTNGFSWFHRVSLVKKWKYFIVLIALLKTLYIKNALCMHVCAFLVGNVFRTVSDGHYAWCIHVAQWNDTLFSVLLSTCHLILCTLYYWVLLCSYSCKPSCIEGVNVNTFFSFLHIHTHTERCWMSG